MPVPPPLLPLAGRMVEQEGRDEETCPPSLNLAEAFKQQSYTSACTKSRSTAAAQRLQLTCRWT